MDVGMSSSRSSSQKHGHRSDSYWRQYPGNQYERAHLQQRTKKENDMLDHGKSMELDVVASSRQIESSHVRRRSWDDTSTVVTTATSEFTYGGFEENLYSSPQLTIRFARYMGPVAASVVGTVAFISPIVMVVLPQISLMSWNIKEVCATKCQSVLISLAWRLLLLLIAAGLLYVRGLRSTMPRIFVFRALIIFMLFIVTFTYWLFYIVRVYSSFGRDQEGVEYEEVAVFAISFTEVLLFVHYLAVILIELRQLDTIYTVKITRSPDGISKSYCVGRLSIQRLAVWCLEQYYSDFEVYNPYLETLPHRVPPAPVKVKVYDIDSPAGDGVAATTESGLPAVVHQRGDLGHNDRFYKEIDYEIKVHRRKARLLTAAEDAFNMVRRSQSDDKDQSSQMSCQDAAQAIFQCMEKPLERYLRVTRQKPWHDSARIIEHIEQSVMCGMSAKAFLERYMTQSSIMWSEDEQFPPQTWTIVCKHVVSRLAEGGMEFQLCKGEVILDISIRQLPNYHLFTRNNSNEENGFVVRFDSEASV